MNRSLTCWQVGLMFAFAASLNPYARGQAGCSTSNCHGSNRIATGLEWNSSSTMWLQRDPHSQSYSRLQLQPSRQIVQRLSGNASLSHDEFQNIIAERCAGCHSNVENSAAQRSLGVDCNYCHGQPEKWLDKHSLENWKLLGDRRYSDFGMRDTERIETRFQLCAECHVGQLRDDGIVQNVDHDLIAAGHPVLHFDFAEYLDRLPAHWDTQQDDIRNGPATDLKKWRVGRFEGLLIRLKLTRDRAAASEIPWPELSEYSCYRCHQSLAKALEGTPQNGSGSIQSITGHGVMWDDWATAELEHSLPAITQRDQSTRLRAFFVRLQGAMHDRQATARTANELIEILDGYKIEETTKNYAILELQKRLESRIMEGPSESNWESAWHWYGELKAIAKSIPNRQVLEDLKKFDETTLRFSTTKADISLRSPANFDARKVAEFQRLFEQSAKATKP